MKRETTLGITIQPKNARVSIKWTGILCCLLVANLFFACKDDDPAPKAVVDTGEWQLGEEQMNPTICPGNDFFMYCNGGFWNNSTVDESKAENNSWFFTDTQQEQRINALTYPSLKKMLADADRRDESTIEKQQERMQSAMRRIEAITTDEEAWKLTAQLMLEGYNTPFDVGLFSKKGKVGAYLCFNGWFDYFNGFVDNRSRNASRLFSKNETGEISTKLHKPHLNRKEMFRILANNPSALNCMQPLVGATRGFYDDRWPMLETFFQTLGIALENAYSIEDYPNEDDYIAAHVYYMEWMQSMSVEEWKDMLVSMLTDDAAFFDDDKMDEVNDYLLTEGYIVEPLTRTDIVTTFGDNYLAYEKSKVFADAYVTPDMKEKTLSICEQLRQTFHTRILANDWMTEATKQNACEKLDAMTFNVGYPDEWYDEGLPDISKEETLYDDILALRRADLNIYRLLAGKDVSKVSFHELIVSGYDLTIVNAFYMSTFNTVNILPAFMMEPLFDANANEAHQYASFMVIGHEITHGFDNIGALFDKFGDLGQLWTSESDSQEFEKRKQQLIDCYNGFEVMPWALPGLYADGDFTVGENIADLGGFNIAYDAYVNHLRETGFKGEQFDLQRKRFYLAYAWYFHGRYTAKFAQMYVNGDENGRGKNAHSLFRERVNGVVSNTDDWYELFDVSSNDSLYRAPEDRVHIW